MKIVIGVGVLLMLWLAMFLGGTGGLDTSVLTALYAGDRPFLADAARLLTLLGGGHFVTPLVTVVALMIALRGRPKLALILFAGNILGRLLVEFQKYELGRLRPDQNPHLVTVYSLSFPSGHSANAVMTYVAMAFLLTRHSSKRQYWMMASVALALLIGLSRVILGVHWPSDVVAGWAFGSFWVLLMLWLADRSPAPDRKEGTIP